MDRERLIQQLQQSAPFVAGEAERAAEVVVRGLVRALGPRAQRELAGRLGIAEASLQRARAARTPEDLAEELAAESGVDLTRASEQVLLVCRTLARQVDSPVVRRLWQELPDALLVALSPSPDSAASTAAAGHPARPVRRDDPHSLSRGRPGSRHPLSSSAPRPPHHDTVAEPNPHATEKLSSAGAEGHHDRRDSDN